MRERVQYWDGRLSSVGLSVRVLQERSRRAIIYVYRCSHLEQLLSEGDCQRFLMDAGYQGKELDGLLEQLTYRLQRQLEFPHEIGIFLGYPLRDVMGFIQNKGDNYTCGGLWKSYGDPTEAKMLFTRYKRCSCIFCKLFEQGIPLEKLAVSA